MTNFIKNITKDEIAIMPKEEFTGSITVIQNEKEAQEAVDYLSSYPIVGFDTETRPSFKKGQTYKIALIQIAVEDVCFLFRVNKIDIPVCLVRFLTDDSIRKIGLSLKDDFGAMRKRSNLVPAGFLDLQSYVRSFGIEEASLQKIYAILFNKRISKGQRLTNWEAENLTDAQKKYASLDAWACLKIYNRLCTELKVISRTTTL